MNTALKTFAWAVGMAAVYIACIVWLGLWREVSLVTCLFVWAIWCGPALGMMAVSDWRYRRLMKKLRADTRKSPNEKDQAQRVGCASKTKETNQ